MTLVLLYAMTAHDDDTLCVVYITTSKEVMFSRSLKIVRSLHQ
jgi:hypothetical protein